MTTIRVRTSSKQAVSQGKKIEMKDSASRLSELVLEWNTIEGWNKYAVLDSDNPRESAIVEDVSDVDTISLSEGSEVED